MIVDEMQPQQEAKLTTSQKRAAARRRQKLRAAGLLPPAEPQVSQYASESARKRAQLARRAARAGGRVETSAYKITASGKMYRKGQPNQPQRLAIKVQVFERDNFRCQVCGIGYPIPYEFDGTAVLDGPRGPLTVGHIKPHSRGGPFRAWNLRAECFTCNNGHLEPDQWWK